MSPPAADLPMFALEGVRGVAVANAHAELKTHAAAQPSHVVAGARFAGGVLEALRHWGQLPQ